MYQKEIIYMGLHKDGSRIGSAGFIKAEKRDKTCGLTIIVKNIPRSIEGRFPVRYCLGMVRGGQETGGADGTQQPDRMDWKEEDGITLRDGGGVWEKKELEASEQIHVQILLPNGYLVEGENKTAVMPMPPKAEMPFVGPTVAAPREPVSAAEPTVITPRESAPAAEPVAIASRESAPAAEPVVIASREPASAAESVVIASREPASAAESVVIASREPAPVKRSVPVAESTASVPQPVVPGRPPLMADALAIEGLKEDKWEQILDTYERIHPYGDGRVYVKIAPKDFIILSGSCQHLVNNSFLLHGFYNYRYVILGRGENSLRELSSEGYSVSSSEKEEYFLGVPGVFYEREKMVALMFGFEAFECEGGNPKPGDFGYYLRKVEL